MIQRQPSQYVLRMGQIEFDLQFYQRYDPSFLYNKAITLKYIMDNQDRFHDAISSEKQYSEHVKENYFASLRAELIFTEKHQFESFFSRNRTRGYAAGCRMSPADRQADDSGSSEGAGCPCSAAVQATVR